MFTPPQSAISKRTGRIFCGILLLLVAGCGQEPPETFPEQPEIVWDEWGVPHIFAAGVPDISYAWGWAQARNHGPLLVRLYGEARARGAEYWGPRLVDQDHWMHLVGLPALAEQWYEEQSPELKDALDAFVAGVNDYLNQNSAEVPADSRAVLPIQSTDVLAHVIRVIHFQFVSNPASLMRAFGSASQANSEGGSNAWAVAPDEGQPNAMLLINPHLPWSDYFTWMEGHVAGPGLNFYGAALVGMPFMALGFNEHLGWTHTVNTIDAADLYRLERRGDGYLWDGEEKAFDVREVTIKVLQEDGTHAEQNFKLRSSIHGPVLHLDDDEGIALRVSGLDRSQLFEQYIDMARARELSEFEEIISRLQIPMFTLIYADRAGHVLSLFGGAIPRRPAGDWNWRGIVPGTSSETLWEETHVYGQLPKVIDPPSGWVQNANEPPWTTTLPYALNPANFPNYMAPRGMAFRPQSSVRLLREDPDTLSEFVDKANSTRMELAERVVDDLLLVLEAGDETEQEAAKVFSDWDRSADADSRGAVLFTEFWNRYSRLTNPAQQAQPGEEAHTFETAWDSEEPTQTPDGLAVPNLVRQALREAAAKVLQSYGALDVPWGEIYRLRRGGMDFPGSGASGRYGTFRVVGYTPVDDNQMASVGGNSFVAAAEFLPDGVQARVLTVYGNSSKSDSIHYGDQLELFAKKQMREVWMTRAEAEAHKSRIEVLNR